MRQGGHLHLDCPSGIAGDMFLAACIELGVPVEVIAGVIPALGLSKTSLETFLDRRRGLQGRRVRVLFAGAPVEGPAAEHEAHEDEHHSPGVPPSRYPDIRRLLERSRLEEQVKRRTLEMFARLAEVEAEAHGVTVDEVHFHELSAVDSLVDIAGAAAAMTHLAPRHVSCGVVAVGSGTITTRHGVLPVPAPATARLLLGVPTCAGGSGELTTPTGALILRTFVDEFGSRPPMVAQHLGYGLGTRELADRANAVCLTLGAPTTGGNTGDSRPPSTLSFERGEQAGDTTPEVLVIECEVDDASGETVAVAIERLLAAGALDAYATPVIMKKGRPGFLVTALARAASSADLARVMLRETGSLGCRFHSCRRWELDRRQIEVVTEFGTIRVKEGALDQQVIVAAPESDDCVAASRAHGISWREVYGAAIAAWHGARKTQR